MKVTQETIVRNRKVVVTGKPGEHLDCSSLDKLGKFKNAWRVETGGILILSGFATCDVSQWARLVGIFGGKVEIRGPMRMVGTGHLVHGDYGTGCVVKEIAHTRQVFKYGMYLGDWITPNGDLSGVDVDGYEAMYGSEFEALVRIMGANGVLRNLRLNNSTNFLGKEALQSRHGVVTIADSEITASASIGRLNPNASEGIPYAKMLSTKTTFKNVAMVGHVQLTGDPTFKAETLRFLKKDTRGISPSVAITNKTFAGYRPAQVSLASDCLKGPFDRLI